MKSIVRITLVSMCLFFLNTFSGKAQWQEISNIYGSNFTDEYAETTNKIVARSAFGLYIADKSDYFWELESSFSGFSVRTIAASGDTIFVVYRGEGVDAGFFLRTSFDEGNTWEESILIGDYAPFFDLHLSYVAQQLVLDMSEGFAGGAIMKSSDLGQSWINEPFPDFIQNVFYVNDNDDSNILFYVNSTDTCRYFIYSVIDGNWHGIQNTNFQNGSSGAYIFNNRVYNLRFDDSLNIYSCAMDGNDCQLIYTNNNTLNFNGFLEINGMMAYLTQEPSTPLNAKELYVSTDNGLTFTHQTTLTNTPSWGDVTKSLESGECIVRSGTELYLMSADFQNYELITDGFVLQDIDYVTSINDVIYAYEPGVFFGRSADNGMNFEDILPTNGELMGGMIHQGDSIYYETLDEETFFKFYRSYNNGATFESFPFGSPNFNYTTIFQKSVFLNNKIYTIFTDEADLPTIFMSADFGETWTTIPCTSLWPGILHVNNGEMYLFSDHLFKYNEQTNTWIDLNSPVENNITTVWNNWSKLRSMGDNLWISNENNEQIVLLSDGESWSLPNNNLLDVVQIGNTIYGLGDQFILASSDFGQTWQPTDLAVPFEGARNMTSHGTQLLVYGGFNTTGTIWRTEAPQIVSGIVYYDANNNGSRDIGEPGVPNVMIHSQNSGTYAMSGVTGSFNMSFNGIEDQLTVEVNNPQYSALPQNFTVSNFDEILIGIQINGSIADLEVDAILNSPFRPGFSTTVTAIIRNQGNVSQGGECTFKIPEQATFTNTSVTPSSETDSTVTWTIGNLNAFETRYINMQLLTDVTAALGDTAVFELNFNAANSDNNLENNSVTNASIIVGAYDPNDKTCYRGELVTPTQLSANNEFEYLIRFQNTGTFYAENVVIQDTISSYFDLATMRIIASSDTMNVTFGENNLVNFNFPLIFLPDSTTNEPESHGFVKYAIRTKPDLQLGTVLRNTAYIYFDFNQPIITNTTETLYDLPSSIELNDEKNVFVYPNPTNATIKLIGYSDQKITVSLSDLSGKIVSVKNCVNGELDLSKLNPGIYLGVIQASKGQPARRFKVVKM
jgi:uncharacterized repeat protein (TIGR01451 family)